MKKILLWMAPFCLWTTVALAEPTAADLPGVYSIQVFAYAQQSAADKAAQQLQEKGVDAFVTSNGQGLYVVRTGRHASRPEAREAAKRLKADRLIGNYLVVATKAPSTPDASGAVAPASDTPEETATAADAEDPACATTMTPEAAGATAPATVAQTETTGPEETANTALVSVKKSAGSQMVAALESIGNRPIAPQMPGFRAAQIALDFLGVKYRWGGMSVESGMDCSGFVKTVYALCGINLPRTSAEQYRRGQPVPRSELSPGDMVFFGKNKRVNHVGIYLGEGKFIHAPRSRKTIRISSLEEGALRKTFLGARRLLFDD